MKRINLEVDIEIYTEDNTTIEKVLELFDFIRHDLEKINIGSPKDGIISIRKVKFGVKH